MIPSRRRLLGLTVLPVLLVAAVLTAVIAVGAIPTPHTAPAGVALPSVVVLDDAEGCQRDHEGTATVEPLLIPAGQRVTSDVIVSCPGRFDGLRVTYVGEAVGDLLTRDGGAWVLVNDDDYALHVGPLPGHDDHRGTNGGLSVWLPDPLSERLTGLGRPGLWGDVIEVTGHISRTDPTDGGGLTLRADELTVLQPSRSVEEPLRRPQLLLALAAVLAAIGAVALRRRGAAGQGRGTGRSPRI